MQSAISPTNQNGFSLIEAILSVVVFGLVITVAAGSYTLINKTISQSSTRTQAILLAEEGQEAIRSIRDSDWANVTDGTYGLSQSGGFWVLTGTPDTTDIFTRSITISTTTNPNIKEIETTIAWNVTGQPTDSLTLTSQLANWKQPAPVTAVFRTNEYYIAPGTLTATTYNLTLSQNLLSDYFVIVQGADGSGTANGNTGPSANYLALASDPWGTGDLNASSGANILGFQRGGNSNSWSGVITVVECVNSCTTAGFKLIDVANILHTGTSTSGTRTTSAPWTDLSRIIPIGGFNGAGCFTTENSSNRMKSCSVRLWPTGTDTINWSRDNDSGNIRTATSTVMAVQFGSSWTIQRVNITGNAGGTGANQVSHYNTAAITPVNRANTFVWGTGHSATNRINNSAEGTLITLGNGVATNATESVVATGQTVGVSRTFDVYVATNPLLSTDYRFKVNGDSSLLSVNVTTNSAAITNQRFALVYNGSQGTQNSYPRPNFSARYSDPTNIILERHRFGENFPAWVQGINFSNITP